MCMWIRVAWLVSYHARRQATSSCGLYCGLVTVRGSSFLAARQCMGAFTVFDLDNNGVIPTDALGTVLRALGLVIPPPLGACTAPLCLS